MRPIVFNDGNLIVVAAKPDRVWQKSNQHPSDVTGCICTKTNKVQGIF